VLFLSQARISQLALLAMAGALVAAGLWTLAGRLSARRVRGAPSPVARLSLWIGMLAMLLGLLVGGAWALGRFDWRIRRVFTFPSHLEEIRQLHPGEVGYAVANRLAFAERVVYWGTGYRVFERYPLFGVGPGNTGFFFEEALPPYGLRLEEIQKVLKAPSYGFPNTKNLWIRLLAETGIVGFAAFGAWVASSMAGAAALVGTRRRVPAMLGIAGLLASIALLGEGFSLDSFALPQMWIVFGLVSAPLVHRAIIEDVDAEDEPVRPAAGRLAGGRQAAADPPDNPR
jgi:O-antigen ligase